MALFWATALIFNVLWLLVAADVRAFRLPPTLLLSHYRGQSNNLPPLGWNTQTTSGQLHTLTHTNTHICRAARPCTCPEIAHLPQTNTLIDTNCCAGALSLFTPASLMHSLLSPHQLAMLYLSVCPDLLHWNWTLWRKLCEPCRCDLSHSLTGT